MKSISRRGGRRLADRARRGAGGLGRLRGLEPGRRRAAPVCPTCRGRSARRATSRATATTAPRPGHGTLGYGAPGSTRASRASASGITAATATAATPWASAPTAAIPFYGGPGYPHPWPTLRRIGGINPFPYYGGPGGPTPDYPNYFGASARSSPTSRSSRSRMSPARPTTANYGCFTGVLPYPETTFAPFTTIAATGGSSSGVSTDSPPNAPPNTDPAPGEMPDVLAAGRSLGIDAEPVIDAGGVPGLKVIRVYPGSAAEKAGLRPAT